MPPKAKDYTGDIYGRLTLLSEEPRKKNKRFWLCQCSCGNQKIIEQGTMRKGETISCGCYHRERSTTHASSKNRLYRTWINMKSRCFDVNQESYPNYGGRGITIQEAWLKFIPFKAWAIQSGYADNLFLDRRNNDGNYCPDNCRWVTLNIQNRNRRKLGEHSSKYTGVVWQGSHNKWRAQIRENYKRKFLGYFDCEKLAAETRDNYIVENDLQGYILNFK